MDETAASIVLKEARLSSPEEAHAYLVGAAHDATRNRLHRTTRFSQADPGWLEVLGLLLNGLGVRSWSYREGRHRSVWALETSWKGETLERPSPQEQLAYVRGYFDAEGGCPRSLDARFYLQFVQKDLDDLAAVRTMLLEGSIGCGRLHNPSVRVDPDYWRFFVLAASHTAFITKVRSWHPRKRLRLDAELGRRRGRPLT